MISSLKRQGLYDVSIGSGIESYEELHDQLNEFDRSFGSMCLSISPSMCYLVYYANYPKDLWKKLDRNLGKHNKDDSINLESTYDTLVVSFFSICINLYTL